MARVVNDVVKLGRPDLREDAQARWVIKNETVAVEFATVAGALRSAVGLNAYAAGDALITGSTGDRWCVSRDRFDVKYRPEGPSIAGSAGRYRNLPVPLLAKQMHEAFSIARSTGGDELYGSAGDWLVQYAPGDYGIVARARFENVYQSV